LPVTDNFTGWLVLVQTGAEIWYTQTGMVREVTNQGEDVDENENTQYWVVL